MGPEVGNVQRFLSELGYYAGDFSETFDAPTSDALRAFQVDVGLPSTGVFDDATRSSATARSFRPFIQAAHFNQLWTPGGKMRAIRFLVIHTMEAPDKPTTAGDVARWFAGSSAPQASAHYCIDDAEIVQCVRDADIAWHAPGANNDGIGLEHAGYASQTAEQWGSLFNENMLNRSAGLAAILCARYAIPVQRLTVAQIKGGEAGLCGHVDITNALNGMHGHTDPGPNFPWARYLELVTTYVSTLTGAATK